MHRVRSNLEPEYLNLHLGLNNRNGRIPIPRMNLTLSKESFLYRGASLWNTLPVSLREIEKNGPFKKALREWIKEKVTRFET